MKIAAAMLSFTLLSVSASAQRIEPVEMVHTQSGTRVYVVAFWAQQFARFEDSAKKHLVIACPKPTWNNANPAKRTAILTAIRRWLNNEDPVSVAKLQELREVLADANIRIELSNDPPDLCESWGLGWEMP